MERVFSYGLYPPPNRIDWLDGVCDLTSGALVAVAGIPDSDRDRLVSALRRAGVPDVEERHSIDARYAPVIAIAPRNATVTSIPRISADGIASEGYRIFSDAGGATLVAHDRRGLRYGVDTLARLIAHSAGRVPACAVEDAPGSPIRGVHLFIPAREDIPFFLALLDTLADLRYNTVFLEIAAGMEFERHPEINRAWETFHRELMAHPRGPKGLQESMWFDWKNDPHATLAGGSYITKDEARRVADRAHALGIDIVPEVQSLAHAYWLTIAHPEIAEAEDDPFPDSYCPSDPRSYTLLFDALDEVMEVFAPRTVHIGHDEVYTMRRCPRCRSRSAADLFADDVTRIHDRLASQGVGTAMWADKLLDIRHPDGNTYGGQFRRVFKGKKQWVMPPTHGAVDRIPRDILLLDWYWSIDDKTPDILAAKGFERLIYGNFPGRGIRNWPEKRRHPIVKGAQISTWCRSSEEDLGRHGRMHEFVEGACTLWWKGYDPAVHGDALARIAQEQIPGIRGRFGTAAPALDEARIFPGEYTPVALDGAPREMLSPGGIAASIAFNTKIPFATSLADGNLAAVTVRFTSPIARIPFGERARELVFLAGTSIARGMRSIDEEMALGRNVVGRLRFHYGDEDSPDRDQVAMDLVYGGALHPWNAAPRSYYADPAATVEGEGPKILHFYAFAWSNPHPERTIRQIDLVWLGGRTMEGEIRLLAVTRRI